MKKINYHGNIQKYVLSQFRNMAGYKEMLKGISVLFEELQTKSLELLNWSIIDKAEGEMLDYIGYLFGVYREYFNIRNYFCVNADDVNREKYFFFENAKIGNNIPQGSLVDRDLRQRIKARIAQLYSTFTRNENIAIIKKMTFAEHVYITKVGTMSVDIELIGSDLFITNKTKEEIESVLGDGVSLETLYINGET